MLQRMRPSDFSTKFDIVKSGWSVVYIEGSHVVISKCIVFLSLKTDFAVANSADPEEMPHHVAFHLGFHCLHLT